MRIDDALTRRWRALGRWGRFAVFAGLILAVTAFLPAWRLPGPEPVTGPATTTATAAPSAFAFDGRGFVERWNSVDLGDEELNTALDLPESAESSGDTVYEVSYSEIGVDWTITVSVDPLDGRVREISLISPLAADIDMSSGAAIILIAAIEEAPIEQAAVIWDALLAPLDETADDEPVSMLFSTDAADYRLALSPTTQFLFEATP